MDRGLYYFLTAPMFFVAGYRHENFLFALLIWLAFVCWDAYDANIGKIKDRELQETVNNSNLRFAGQFAAFGVGVYFLGMFANS